MLEYVSQNLVDTFNNPAFQDGMINAFKILTMAVVATAAFQCFSSENDTSNPLKPPSPKP